MSTLKLTLTDVEDGEVEIKMETDESPNLCCPTPAEHKLGLPVAALKKLNTKGAPANDVNWLFSQSSSLH